MLNGAKLKECWEGMHILSSTVFQRSVEMADSLQEDKWNCSLTAVNRLNSGNLIMEGIF